jgi:hypothetical protein
VAVKKSSRDPALALGTTSLIPILLRLAGTVWHSQTKMLSEDSDTEDVHNFTINEHYARAFEYKKEREELFKCTSYFLSVYR